MKVFIGKQEYKYRDCFLFSSLIFFAMAGSCYPDFIICFLF